MTAPARFIVGDVLDVLATLPEASVTVEHHTGEAAS